ncbi:hypothetical protein [Legionella spiritensis]|uniref:hypothetical protein n=1 Tax=Legionella spiritensis TaxID=452 RepID=UPI000F6B3DD6|nr:hypothetical protein [Legionella spiritensis]VEG91949.1 Ankyrin repeat protein [Legionella spiritensis]
MAKLKEFPSRHDYIANHGGKDQSNTTSYTVETSDYGQVVRSLRDLITDGNVDALEALLQGEYVHPEVVKTIKRVTYDSFPKSQYMFFYGMQPVVVPNPSYGKGQRDTMTYETHWVSSVREELFIRHKEDFLALLGEASEPCRKALLNFAGMDLSGGDISDVDVSLADFTDCDLTNTTGVTQEKLDSALPFCQAWLPQGMVPFWSAEKKGEVLRRIAELDAYGEQLRKSSFKDARDRGDIAVALAGKLWGQINAPDVKHNGAFQERFLTTLHSQDHNFEHKRFYGLKTLIANIAFAVLGVGIFYAAAGLMHMAATGRFLFFDRTETEQQVEKIATRVCAPSA